MSYVTVHIEGSKGGLLTSKICTKQAENVEAKPVEELNHEEEPESSKDGTKSPIATPPAPMELLRKSEQLAQSPKSAYV